MVLSRVAILLILLTVNQSLNLWKCVTILHKIYTIDVKYRLMYPFTLLDNNTPQDQRLLIITKFSKENINRFSLRVESKGALRSKIHMSNSKQKILVYHTFLVFISYLIFHFAHAVIYSIYKFLVKYHYYKTQLDSKSRFLCKHALTDF